MDHFHFGIWQLGWIKKQKIEIQHIQLATMFLATIACRHKTMIFFQYRILAKWTNTQAFGAKSARGSTCPPSSWPNTWKLITTKIIFKWGMNGLGLGIGNTVFWVFQPFYVFRVRFLHTGRPLPSMPANCMELIIFYWLIPIPLKQNYILNKQISWKLKAYKIFMRFDSIFPSDFAHLSKGMGASEILCRWTF